MKIATIDPQTDQLAIADQPAPASAARVLASAINPMDIAVSRGVFPFRSYSPGMALGYSGVAEAADGKRYYFYNPAQPAGALSEFVDLDSAEKIELPAGLNPELAAVIGVPGIAAHSALFASGNYADGQTVLIVGAAGSVGLIAGAVALAHGSRVLGLARAGTADAQVVAGAGMTPVTFSADDPSQVTQAVRAQAPEGIDVAIDSLWGEYPQHLLPTLADQGRWVQIGSSAGNDAVIPASAFRNTKVDIVGHTIFKLSDAATRAAYSEVAQLAAAGRIDLPYTSVSFDELPSAWSQLTAGERHGKLVVEPGR